MGLRFEGFKFGIQVLGSREMGSGVGVWDLWIWCEVSMVCREGANRWPEISKTNTPSQRRR